MKKIYMLSCALALFVTVTAQAQEFDVSGKITDARTGDPMAGISVLVKGTTRGVVSDMNGDYTLKVPSSPSTLQFSFIGFRTKEVEVTSSNTKADIALEEDITNLEEVVITGLASSIKRSNLANAISTVSAQELTGTTGQSTLDGAMYGKLTGVNIVASSGAPGGGIGVRLRGISSISGNNQPLYIVDGVYISNAEIPSGLRFASGANRGNEENSANRIADLNPNDIENIEVLKGASAAAIYGTRANAGVIIITTKRGASGKTKINFGQDFGFNKIQRYLGMRSFNSANVAATFGGAEADRFNAAQSAGKVYNYEKEIYGETGMISNSNLSITGGDDKTKFYAGGSLRSEDGIIKGTGFDRKSLRLNLDHKFSKKVSIGVSSNYINSNTERGFTGNENEGGLSYGYNLSYTRPWTELHPDEFGNYPDNPDPGTAGNMLLVRDKAKNTDKVNRFIQGAKLDYNIFQNSTTYLKFTANGGLDFFVDESFVYVPENHQSQREAQNGFIGVGKNTFTNLNYQSFIILDKYLMGGKLRLGTQAGISYLNFDRDLVYNQTTQLIPGQTSLSQGGSQAITQRQENEEEFGVILQEEANYDDKIIATIGVRSDKSSLNGDPNKFYPFLKGSLALNIANFGFWTIEPVNQLKLRAAYGETGSSARYGSLFTVFDATNIEGRGGIIINPNKGTPNLIPETSSELEFGIDIGLFNNLIGLEVTYFNRKVKDLLFDRSLPTSSGFSSEVLNDADLKNTGLEVAVTAQPLRGENITWNTTVNFWTTRSTLTRLGVPPFVVPNNGFGLGLGTFYLQEGNPVTAIVQNVAGVPTIVGDTQPDYQMSFINSFTFLQNFEFSSLFHLKKGGENLNLTKLLTDDGGNSPEIDARGAQYADTYVQPSGYFRLREIALYYNLPKGRIAGPDRLFDSIRIGVSGRNLWTKTDYKGYDPEVSTNGSGVISNGLDVAPYPSTKQAFFHINFTL
jgi:TonB-linked SusC/RagA family outer membrane protein